MTIHPILFPTKKLYSNPEYRDYTEQKNKFIKREFKDIEDSVKIRWTALMDKFVDSDFIKLDWKYAFTDFKRNRLNIDNHNINVISIDKSLDYFENYYFLCFNNSPPYILSVAKRESLLQ
jgi:hypothetical protein